MLERLDATFFFGTLGNLSGAMGEGWSVEDNFAWAVGSESRLTLPLPGDQTNYKLRLTVQPLLHPGLCDAQRLTIATATGPLAEFSIDRNTVIELALPLELTRDKHSIELLLRHPDAMRPSEFKQTDDTRMLSVCFMSGALRRQSDDASEEAAAEICHLVVAGGDLARQLAKVMAALPGLRQRVACHYVDSWSASGASLPPEDAVQSATICWEQSGGNPRSEWPRLREMLPDSCELRRFPLPRMEALWPFLGADPRLVPEPGRYDSGRYPFGDRIAADLAHLPLPDDIMQLSYLSMTEKDMPDLDVRLAADRAAWRTLDATHDIKVADFIVENFRRYRLFFAPQFPTGELLRHMVLQLVAGSPLEALCDPGRLRRDLDFLLIGYIGRRQELPIHPLVARRFALAWWRPDMRYHWFGNQWTFEEYVLHYIRWTPWRP